MRGETRIKKHEHRDQCISIHSPHARGDRVGAAITNLRNRISIHSPHARGDRVHAKRERGGVSNFNPLPSCEGRRGRHVVGPPARYFNPLPSCEGRPSALFMPMLYNPFQSTPLMRGETSAYWRLNAFARISIHSPHARGDVGGMWSVRQLVISIHSPHARGDFINGEGWTQIDISIHSPHARGDSGRVRPPKGEAHFNPLPSCEGRRLCPMDFTAPKQISIHSPHARGDFWFDGIYPVAHISIHSPHARGDAP